MRNKGKKLGMKWEKIKKSLNFRDFFEFMKRVN